MCFIAWWATHFSGSFHEIWGGMFNRGHVVVTEFLRSDAPLSCHDNPSNKPFAFYDSVFFGYHGVEHLACLMKGGDSDWCGRSADAQG
jgi:hypothetical protein